MVNFLKSVYKKVAIYCRASTLGQIKDEGTIISQEHRGRERVDQKNHFENWGEVKKVYRDEGKSGANTDREQFQLMKHDIARGFVNTVIVTELSRLSRSVTDFLDFACFLKEHNAHMICLQTDIDTTSPVGSVITTILMALHQFERELVCERTKMNMLSRARRGLYNGGTLPFGYDIDKTKAGLLKINHEEAEIVKRIFELYQEVGSLNALVKKCKELGFYNKNRS